MPTFIMDGFEVTAEKVFDLDPMRIESMTILKDAAATAIYGSRASNGVVVINTKQPLSLIHIFLHQSSHSHLYRSGPQTNRIDSLCRLKRRKDL